MATVSLVMPARDEEEGLTLLRQEFSNSILSKKTDFTFIIVADARSTDRTEEISQNLADIVIIQREKWGKGEAVKSAIKKWSENPTEILIMMDADGSYQWDDIEKVIHVLESGAQVVTGIRLRGLFRRVEGMSMLHHLGNHALAFLASVRNRSHIRDLCSGLWGFRAEAIMEISPSAGGFDLEAEIHGKIRALKIPLVQIPIKWRRRVGGEAKIRPFVDGLRILYRVIKT
tara:strand:- start:2660 stop:3349 length:690 start_codon:yes stop_codon:yes gene_type:complete